MIISFLMDGVAKIITRLKKISVLTPATIKHLPAGRQRAKNVVIYLRNILLCNFAIDKKYTFKK